MGYTIRYFEPGVEIQFVKAHTVAELSGRLESDVQAKVSLDKMDDSIVQAG